MIQQIIDKLMGQAGEGNRKMAYGTLALILLFVFMMWAPDVTPETRRTALSVWAGVVVAIVGGNIMEHRANAKALVIKAGAVTK